MKDLPASCMKQCIKQVSPRKAMTETVCIQYTKLN